MGINLPSLAAHLVGLKFMGLFGHSVECTVVIFFLNGEDGTHGLIWKVSYISD